MVIEATPKARQERIKECTARGGLLLNNDLFITDEDWEIIKEANPFTILFINHLALSSITDQMIRDNRQYLLDYWGRIVSSLKLSENSNEIIKKHSLYLLKNYEIIIRDAFKAIATHSDRIATIHKYYGNELEKRIVKFKELASGLFTQNEIAREKLLECIETGFSLKIPDIFIIESLFSLLIDNHYVSSETPPPSSLNALLNSRFTKKGTAPKLPGKNIKYKKFIVFAVPIAIVVISIFIIFTIKIPRQADTASMQNPGDTKQNKPLSQNDSLNSVAKETLSDSKNIAEPEKALSKDKNEDIFSESISNFSKCIKTGKLDDALILLENMKGIKNISKTESDKISKLNTLVGMLKQMVYIPSLNLYFDKYETTIDQYSKFLAEYNKISKTVRLSAPALTPENSSGNQPIQYVSCDDASKYASFYNKRIPTLSEWTAALGTEDALIYGGFSPYDYANLAGKSGTDKWEKSTSPVGSFKPNRFGLYDLVGNVAEWCVDPSSSSYAYVVGGTLNSRPEELKRSNLSADQRYSSIKYYNVGFRCVFDPSSLK